MIALMGKCPTCGNMTDNTEGPIVNIKGDLHKGRLVCSEEEEGGCGWEGETDLAAILLDSRDTYDEKKKTFNKHLNRLLNNQRKRKG